MKQPNIATSLIEKVPMNTQFGVFLDKLEFQWSFLFERKSLPNCSFVSDQLNYFTHFLSVPQDAMSTNQGLI